MKYLVLISGVLIFCNCENENFSKAEDIQENVTVVNNFNFELIGAITDKMKTVTSINIKKIGNSERHQTLDGFEAKVQENEQVIIEDLNFDGYLDIRLLQYLPETANIPFFYWLYNPKTEKFERNLALEVIQSPVLDSENEYILSQWTKTDNIKGIDFYKFIGNRIKLIKQETETFTDSVNYILTIKEVFGDSLKLVEQKKMQRKGIIQSVINNEHDYHED
jgi:hypothetical protein